MKYQDTYDFIVSLLEDTFTSDELFDFLANNEHLLSEIQHIILLAAGPHITKRGCSHTKRNEYLWVSDHAPTLAEISEAQTKIGFHPAGYGCDRPARTVSGDIHFTRWTSSGTCD